MPCRLRIPLNMKLFTNMIFVHLTTQTFPKKFHYLNMKAPLFWMKDEKATKEEGLDILSSLLILKDFK